MTKKTFHYITELGWLLMAIMPLFLYMITAFGSGGGSELITFKELMEQKLGFFFNESNTLYNMIMEIFGNSGAMPLFTENVGAFLAYYITVEIAHLLVDIIIFIPRMAQSWMTTYTKKGS